MISAEEKRRRKILLQRGIPDKENIDEPRTDAPRGAEEEMGLIAKVVKRMRKKKERVAK